MQQEKRKSSTPYNTITLPRWMLVLLFITPLVIALVIYINWNNIYFNKNKGFEVSPPFNLQFQTNFDMQDSLVDLDSQQKHWNIVYLAPKKCDFKCQQRKNNLAKGFKTFNNKQDKVQLFSTLSPLVKLYNNSKYQALILKEDNLIITDPDNKILMYYEPNTSVNMVLKDLRNFLAIN